MGCHCSKMHANAPSVIHSLNNAYLNQAPTNLGANVPLRSLSLDTLKEATARLLEKNQEVVGVILGCKKEIRKNPELLVLVKGYLDNGLHNLDFCNALKKCLKIAQNSQSVLHLALQSFDQADDPTVKEGGGTKYDKVIDELKRFKENCDLFAKEFLQVFQLFCQHQLPMLRELRLKKKKLDRKLKSVKAWKKLSCILFSAASAVLLIFSVVAAIATAPPIAAAISAACSAMGKWFDSMLNERKNAIEREKSIISSLKAGTSAGIKDMNGIRFVVSTLEDQVSSLLENGEFKFSDEKAVSSGIEEIEMSMELFMKSIDDLVTQANQCLRDIERARTVVRTSLISSQLSGEMFYSFGATFEEDTHPMSVSVACRLSST